MHGFSFYLWQVIRQIKHLFLYTAWAILFVHSVVPHQHEQQPELLVCASAHTHASDVLDFLGHIFHFSTGQDHLESFNAERIDHIGMLPTADAVVFVHQIARGKTPFYTSQKTKASRYRHSPLRAPPVYS